MRARRLARSRTEPRSVRSAAVALLQEVDFEIGRILRQVVDRGLHRELGFERFDRYATERLDLAPRTAQRMVALARAEHRAPTVATAFRRGRVTGFQAHAVLWVADVENAERWVARARGVTLRRLEVEVEVHPQGGVAFRAPREVAALFLAMVRRVGLEVLLDHAIETWTRLGRAPGGLEYRFGNERYRSGDRRISLSGA